MREEGVILKNKQYKAIFVTLIVRNLLFGF